MCRLIESYPRSSPWISAGLASTLYVLLTWIMEEDPLISHTLEVVAVGIAVFLVVRWKAARPARW